MTVRRISWALCYEKLGLMEKALDKMRAQALGIMNLAQLYFEFMHW